MDERYEETDWRADEFTLIRGDYCATVSRPWCAEQRPTPWRWNVFRTDAADCSSIVPDEVRQGDFSFGDAIKAAEAFIAQQEHNERTVERWASFDGVPAPEVEGF